MKFTITFKNLENWVKGTEDYVQLVIERLYAIMVREAPMVEQWMRVNALWNDECMPGKEYLRALPYRDDARNVVGIVAFYDQELYNRNCPDQDVTFDFSIEHEFKDYVNAGKIAILNPKLSGAGVTVFDEPFPDVMQAILREFK